MSIVLQLKIRNRNTFFSRLFTVPSLSRYVNKYVTGKLLKEKN